jgi:hypothetical protein
VLGAESVQRRLRLEELDELRDLFQMVVERPERQIARINLPLALLEIAEHQLPKCKGVRIEAGDVPEVVGTSFDGTPACEVADNGIVQGSLTLRIVSPRAEIL